MRILCKCGCKKKLEKYDSRGRKREFLHGHNVNRKGTRHTEATLTKIRLARKRQVFSKETRRKMSDAHQGSKNHFYGKRHTEETIENLRKIHKENPSRYWLGKKRTISKETRDKMINGIRESRRIKKEEKKKKLSEKLSQIQLKRVAEGKHHLWRGGVTPLYHKIRTSPKFKTMLADSKKRDGYICQVCGQKGGVLHSNHIVPFAKLIKENNIKTLEDALICTTIWDSSNLETLCLNCHKNTDSYLNRWIYA